MKVGSDNSIFSLISTMPRKASASGGEQPEGFALPTRRQAPSVESDQDLVAEFHARLARQALDWADTDKDGKVTKSEYMDGQARLAALNKVPHDVTVSEGLWAKLDGDGKGWLSADELGDSLEKLIPVKVGHLDRGYAERLRNG